MAWASLSLMWTWLNVSGRSGYLARSYTLADQAASYACCLAALVLIALLARRLWARPAVLSLAGAACIVAGSAVSAAVGQPVGDGARLAAGAGLLLSGIGYMPCLIGLLFGLARAFPYRLAPPVVLLAVLFRQQASPLLALLPSDAQVRAIAVLLAVFAAALMGFWALWGRLVAAPGRPEGPGAPAEEESPWRVVLLGCMADVTLYVFGMASGVGLVPDAGSAATRGVIATAPGKLAALAVTAGLGAAALVAPAGWPPSRRYAPAFVALAASTTLGGFSVVLGGSPAGSLASACLQGVYDFNEALVWSLASCASGGRDRIGLRRGACVAMAFQVAAIAASWLPLDIPAGLGAALLAAYGFLVIVAAVVLPLAGRQDGGEAGSPGEASQAAVADVLAGALGQRCQAVAGAHGLTPREAEVLCLLVQGKSRRAVCQELSMSEGTVKTHIAHIYEKTGVNTREALSDLVFER